MLVFNRFIENVLFKTATLVQRVSFYKTIYYADYYIKSLRI